MRTPNVVIQQVRCNWLLYSKIRSKNHRDAVNDIILYIYPTQADTHSQNISDKHTKFYINRRNGISTITHSYRKNPCVFHCKNPFRTLKATINYNCRYTTMITRSHNDYTITHRPHVIIGYNINMPSSKPQTWLLAAWAILHYKTLVNRLAYNQNKKDLCICV